MFLSGILRKPGFGEESRFPWTLPLIRNLQDLEFVAPVTFLVGENGSGKSTLLEGLAAGMKAVPAGARRGFSDDESLAAAREFSRGYTFVRRRAPRAKLFLRAEDVFGFIRRLGSDMGELRDLEEEFKTEFAEGSVGRALAVGVARGERMALERRYGADPDAKSHGETFLSLLQSRLAPRGLYFLDEPETPLSPIRVLALMALLKDRVAEGCQFVIATHSPILMALPGAEILLFEDGRIMPTPWEEIEHVRITRAFLNDPESYLRRL